MKKHHGVPAERYQMAKVSDVLKMPAAPNLAKIDPQLVLKRWHNLADDNVFDRTNYNWAALEQTINDVIKNQNALIDWQAAMLEWGAELSANLENIIDEKVLLRLQTYETAAAANTSHTSLQQQILNQRAPVNTDGQYPGLIQDSKGGES
ncbi:hypothetical protein [Schleiferilactobacillus harbinensis]|uniref:Uncharacterized protein n=1 Tax=Schleiferilactobacillus harbinensis TaxID=304207 RepID=A0A5P8M6J0_9LACO|nr:hypothetical protein [Schleiferilactobacillus harbinensis]QFR24079.1 hypothetical protein D1010_12180 [Schleiferilactobacillus harbinensis]